jgi:hypothetical protein
VGACFAHAPTRGSFSSVSAPCHVHGLAVEPSSPHVSPLLVEFVGKRLHLLFAERSFDVFDFADELLPGFAHSYPVRCLLLAQRGVRKNQYKDVYCATVAGPLNA